MAVKLTAMRQGMLGAFRLGWVVETNWTHPLAYLVFLLLRPVGGALILVFIYKVAVGGPLNSSAVEFLVVGAALWSYVITGLQGISLTVIQEREWFKVLKYVVITPLPLSAYVLARSAVRLVTGTVGAVMVLTLADLLLDLELSLATIDWPRLLVAMVLGLAALEGLGVGLAGTTMAVARHPFGVSEGVAGVLYLLSGAVFPISLLPDLVEPVAYLLPFTYWLEGVRRALLPSYDPSVMGIGDPLLPLLVTSAATVVLGGLAFRGFNRRTRRLGRYDWTTEY
ncbi:MAG: ABC transporter permease [Acidimicrobiia bacterium]